MPSNKSCPGAPSHLGLADPLWHPYPPLRDRSSDCPCLGICHQPSHVARICEIEFTLHRSYSFISCLILGGWYHSTTLSSNGQCPFTTKPVIPSSFLPSTWIEKYHLFEDIWKFPFPLSETLLCWRCQVWSGLSTSNHHRHHCLQHRDDHPHHHYHDYNLQLFTPPPGTGRSYWWFTTRSRLSLVFFTFTSGWWQGVFFWWWARLEYGITRRTFVNVYILPSLSIPC